MTVRINSMEELKKRTEMGAEFFIFLRYNLRNSKLIVWDEKEGLFYVTNFIDETEQRFTEEQMMDRECANIGYAMTKGALFKDDSELLLNFRWTCSMGLCNRKKWA